MHKSASERAGVDTAGIPQVDRVKTRPGGVNAIYVGRAEDIYYSEFCPARVRVRRAADAGEQRGGDGTGGGLHHP